jgi:hypothetical protein
MLAVAAIGLLVDAALTTIVAAPVQPYVLFGLAKTQSGTPVTSGILIEARIGNVHYGQTVNPSTGAGSQDTRTHSLNSGVNYGFTATFQVCTDDPATGAIEGGVTGDSVVFFVAGIQAEARRVGVDGSPQASIPFAVGSTTQRVDLTIPSLTAPTAIPGSASVFACTPGGGQIAPPPTANPTSQPVSGGVGGAASPTPTATGTPTPTGTPTATPTPTAVPSSTSTDEDPEPIPVASTWGLAALGAVLAALTVLVVRRKPGTVAD